MINKNKLKEFLKSNYSIQTKLFVLDVLKGLVEKPSSNSHFVMYIYDLDIFEDAFVNPPNSYFVIDFIYLESLDSKIREYYLGLLREGIDMDDTFSLHITVNNASILVEHGVILTNIEHLKMKRQKKLEAVDAKRLINGEEDLGDFFDLAEF